MDIFFGYGYLGKHLFNENEIKVCKDLNGIKSFINEDFNNTKVFNSNIKNLWYFASPQKFETISDKSRLYETYFLTDEIIKICNLYNIHLIFANSLGVYEIDKSEYLKEYLCLKHLNATKIRENCKSYTILNIPRVYSKDRDTGLIKALKNKVGMDKSKILEYIDIKEFVEYTFMMLKQNPKEVFYNTKKNSILSIENEFLK